MSLDSASYQELWNIFDKTGVRPEYLLPVLWGESQLNPSAPNGQGADFWGINQISGNTLRAAGITPATYLTWPASQQLRLFVGPYVQNQVAQHGAIRSATRLYQANFIPASLDVAKNFGDVILARGGNRYGGQEGSFYQANAALDIGNKGAITVGDLAQRVNSSLPSVNGAIAQAYAVRPGTAENPVFGEDFTPSGQYIEGGAAVVSASSNTIKIILAAGLLGAVALGSYWLVAQAPPRRRLLRG